MRSIFGLLFLSLLINACGKKFVSGTSTLASVCQTKAIASSKSSNKVKIYQLPQAGLTKAASEIFLDKVTVRVDARCLSHHHHLNDFLGLKLSQQNLLGMENFFNFAMELKDVSLTQLQEAARDNVCVVGVADHGQVQKSQFQAAVTNDANLNQQGHLAAHEYWSAYDYFYTPSSQGEISEDVVIAVVDTGIQYTHPDLSCNMWPGNGIDLVNIDNDPMDDDPQGHGTHVAGLIGACGNNAIGGTGIMGSRVQLMGVKALDATGAGDISVVADAIDWAVDNNADIINLSLEAPGRFNIIRQAIQRAVDAGVVVVGAAGNGDGNGPIEISSLNPVTPAIDGDIGGMIAVGSVDSSSLQISSFSNYSTTFVEIAAAGSRLSYGSLDGVYSTQIGGGYTRIAGTSQAAPVVAGAIGLMIGFLKSRNITYTAANIEGYLRVKGIQQRGPLLGSVADGAVLNLRVLSANLSVDYGDVTNSSFQICP